MPGRFSLYPDLSVEENLRVLRLRVRHDDRSASTSTIAPIYAQLEPFKDRRAGALSGGMKQKLALCCALVHRPEILFLDEPTTGVDAVSRREFWDLLGAPQGRRPHHRRLDAVHGRGRPLRSRRADAARAAPGGRHARRRSHGRSTVRSSRVRADATLQGAARAARRTRTRTRAYPFGDVIHYTDKRDGRCRRDAGQTDLTAFLAATRLCRRRASSRPTPTVEDTLHGAHGATRARRRSMSGARDRGAGPDPHVRRLHRRAITSPSTCARARSSASSARTARARRRRSGC